MRHNKHIGAPIDASKPLLFPNNTALSMFPQLPICSAKPIFYDLAYDLIANKNENTTDIIMKEADKWSFFGLMKKNK